MAATAINKCLVKIEKVFIDEITTSGGLTLFLDPSYSKEHNVASIGKIVSLSTSHDPQYDEMVSKLNIGDEVYFSYRVVGDFTFEPDSDKFIDIHPDSPETFKKFSNGKGEWVIVRALPKPSGIGKTWVGVHTSNRNEMIDSRQGDEHEISRWLATFNIGKTDTYVFNNLIDVNGEELWKVPYSEIFAKKGKNGIIGVGDRVIGEPLDIELSEQVREMYGMALPQGSIQARWQDRFRAITGVRKIGLQKGDIVGYDPKYLEKYTLDKKEYYLIKHRRVDILWS